MQVNSFRKDIMFLHSIIWQGGYLSFKLEMNRSLRERRSNLVLALDLPLDRPRHLLSQSMKVLKKVHPHVCAVKINHHLVLPLGLFNGVQKIIQFAHDQGLPTIMDCKINDIGSTNRVIAEYYYEAGFDAVIANPFVGWDEGLQPVFEVARQMDKGVILLVYMSHKGAEEGYGQTVLDSKTKKQVSQYHAFAEKALSWSSDGAVVGATYPDKIKEVHAILGNNVPIYSPGIGAQGGDIDLAMKAGARYLIVGRTVVLATDPVEALKGIKKVAERYLEE
jgi:orotidine-5'-phosphate decarboxylase